MTIPEPGPVEPPPENPVPQHTWYVGSERRYCTKCGVFQDAVTPGVLPLVWTPDVPVCTGSVPSSAAEIREGEEGGTQSAKAAPAKVAPAPAAASKPPTKVAPAKMVTPLRYKR